LRRDKFVQAINLGLLTLILIQILVQIRSRTTACGHRICVFAVHSAYHLVRWPHFCLHELSNSALHNLFLKNFDFCVVFAVDYSRRWFDSIA